MPLLSNITELNYRLKGLPADIAMLAGFKKPAFFRAARGSRILVYHGVCRKEHLKFNTLFVTERMFEKHLLLYKKYCNLISLDDHYAQRFSDKQFNICLSFDDGFANNHKYVLPLLEKYEIPAVFFITGIREAGYDILWNDILAIAYRYGPGKLIVQNEEYQKGKDSRYVSVSSGKLLADVLRSTDFDTKKEMIEQLQPLKQKVNEDHWLQMTEEQIKELSASKWVTIGCHSRYHNDLAKLPGAVAKEDMLRSKQYLEKVTDKEVKAMAFPYGSYTRETITLAKEAGFTQLLATEFLFPDDATETTLKERLTINPFISAVNQLSATIKGHYD